MLSIRYICLLLLLPYGYLMADNVCKIDDSIMITIAKVERNTKREVGYPYLISLNKIKDKKRVAKMIGKKIFIDSRTIDCRNQKLCTNITTLLINNGIKNLDLGAYQINYKYHKMKLKEYFSFKSSYKKACLLITKLIKKHGYTWRTIARYHSATPLYNYAYLEKISNLNERLKR